MSVTINADGLAWLGFWIFLAVLLWASHKQFLAGYDNLFFAWKNDDERNLRAAAIAAAERNAPPGVAASGAEQCAARPASGGATLSRPPVTSNAPPSCAYPYCEAPECCGKPPVRR